MSAQADFHATNVMVDGLQSKFTLWRHDTDLGEIVLNLPGLHNVYNAMAGIVVGMELDIPLQRIASALRTIEGVRRRLEIKGHINEITVVDDYGHHPTEIKTTLRAVKASWPEKRIVVVFQPHRYTRTKALFDDFTRAFYQSDILIVLPIYAAGEKPLPGVEGRLLFEGIKAHGHKRIIYKSDFDSTVSHLKRILKPNDILLTLGAGDVPKVGEALLNAIS
jgi:UDP-N-acetylmuramate--alanine ligase